MPQHDEHTSGYSRGIAIKGGFLVDVSEQAHDAGISYPVAVSADLLQSIQPTPYLTGLGLSLESRIQNILTLLCQQLTPVNRTDAEGVPENRFALPLFILKGPIVREELISVIAIVHPGDTGQPVVTILRACEKDRNADD